jgi:hypothetical protein
MKRTAVYIDGFNLYYRALKGTDFKWLDPLALSRVLLHADNDIVLIRYFTARVDSDPSDPTKHVRQDTYFRALKAHIPFLTIHEGTFLRHPVRMPLVQPPRYGGKTVEVWKTEEKGSDVNLASHLLNDAWLDAFDAAFVITNDSDQAEAIRLTVKRGKAVGVCCTERDVSRPASYELRAVSSFTRRIAVKHLRQSQMPDQIPGTTITKPSVW